MTQAKTNNRKTPLDTNGLEIAVIGIAGRFPGASTIDKFWQNLRNGVECISFFSNEELMDAGISKDHLDNPKYVKARGVLDDIEWFDASYFGYTPREAEIMDPQQRIFLECAVEALENAGYHSDIHKGPIGVYAGAGMNTYLLKNLYSNPELMESVGDFETMIGNDKDFLTTRVSYKLNLEGPSVAVQTACSSSLVAVCMACQSLLSGECDIVLAGGVSINLPQKTGYLYQEGGILSPDGHCRAFDAKAQGTAFSSGVGIVVLKRLDDALHDKDNIYAVIKGSALNNDGSFKIGFTAPRVDGQAKAIKTAQIMAEINPSTISYIEAHGTGTPLGDPIEVAALTQVFNEETQKKGYCAIGSVKTNIGHADAAAGIAGLIKTVLMLKHKEIPPSLHFELPNPKIEIEKSPFYVNTKLKSWTVDGYPRRAGVSSFGIGGTNAHVVLEEAPPQEPVQPSQPWQLVLLSAKSATALEAMTADLAEHLKRHPDINMDAVAYTLQVGRTVFAHRRMLICDGRKDAIDALENPNLMRTVDTIQEQVKRKPVFMFSGQGSQYVDMGATLYRDEPVFREQVDRCAQILKPLLGEDLRTILYPDKKHRHIASQQLGQTAITQIALFVIEYSLARLWMAWRVNPSAMVGHSIGEYVAACLAGVFSLDNALSIVVARGRMMQQMPKGSMLAVALSEQAIKPYLNDDISLAAVNGPELCVLSAEKSIIDTLSQTLSARGTFCRLLHTSHAFHSHMMTPIVGEFIKQFKTVQLNAPKIPFISNVTGNWIKTEEATDPFYWARHLRQTIRFADAMHRLSKDVDHLYLEIGPGNTLSMFARQYLGKSASQHVFSSLRHPKEQRSDTEVILDTIGRLWLAGKQPDWYTFHANSNRRRLSLSTYPFDRLRYWVEPSRKLEAHPDLNSKIVKNPNISEWFYIPFWHPAKAINFDIEDIAIQETNWMIFMDTCGLGNLLASRLRQLGQKVTCIAFGQQFVHLNDHEYIINPEQPDDYNKLFTKLQKTNHFPQKIIHLGNVIKKLSLTDDSAFFDKIQYQGFYSLLFLAQVIGNHKIKHSIQILIISNDMQAVTGKESVCSYKATLLGPCMVIPKEYQNVACQSIDITEKDFQFSPDSKIVDNLLSEFNQEFSNSVLAYRDHERWLQSLKKIKLKKSTEPNNRLRKGGVYLITGGLGGIGLTIGEYLAKTVQANLIFIGRSPFPQKNKWNKYLSKSNHQIDICHKINRVKHLESLGSKVLIIAADVTDRKQMKTAIAKSERRFGKIQGVIHAAGILNDGIIQLKKQEDAAKVLAPKLKGALVIDSLFKNGELDFLILFSSNSSFFAPVGQVDYSAANAFLDAFAQHNYYLNKHLCVSINWNLWRDVGLAVGSTIDKKLFELSLSPKEGVEVFNRILSSNESPQIIVSTISPEAWKKLQASNLTDNSDLGRTKIPSTDLIQLNKTRDKSSSNDAVQLLAEIWQNLLGIKEIGIHDDFFGLGGNSLIALRLFNKIEEFFDKKIPLATLYQAPTIYRLARVIEQKEIKSNRSSLVEIQSNGSKKPLFLVHGAGGNILLYKDLVSHLETDQPIYGLQSRSFCGQKIYDHRVEDMAAHYLKEIKSIQPEGPYYLGGYCLGGTISLEIAQQLLANNERVAFLALLETYNWSNIGPESFFDRSYFYLQKLVFHFLNFNQLKFNDKYKFFCKKFIVAGNRRKVWYGNFLSLFYQNSKLNNNKSSHLSELWKINDLAAMNYVPKLYSGTITHFRPIMDYARHNYQKVGWENLAAVVETHKLPVYPAGMLLEPFACILADKLQKCIQRALEQSEFN